MSASRQRYECSRCHQVYSTSSHLRRHEATREIRLSVCNTVYLTYNSDVLAEHFICQFCERKFVRRFVCFEPDIRRPKSDKNTSRDVLRRHFQSCKWRGNNPTPSEGKKGRKRKACDACVQSRTQCDGELPCETCLHRRLKCSLSRNGEQDGKARHNQEQQEKPEDSTINRIPVHFLLNYTDPASRGLYDMQQMLSGCDKDSRKYASLGKSEVSKVDGATEQWMGLFHLFIDTAMLDKSGQDESLMYGLADTEKLSNTVWRILDLMKHALKSQIDNNGQATMKEARRFFSPTNVTLFIKAFFEHSYKNTRFIHKASFNVHTTSSQLLLAIALMGAICVSSQDASIAEGYSDVAEHIIFDGPEFGQAIDIHGPSLTKANMETLQAAMLITVIQGSKDDITIKRRIRTQRFPALVCAARALRLTQATNDAVSDTEPLDLDRYFHKESLVRLVEQGYLVRELKLNLFAEPWRGFTSWIHIWSSTIETRHYLRLLKLALVYHNMRSFTIQWILPHG